MNLKHKNIKFTFDSEHSNSSFLDVKISPQNRRFITSTFRATFSEVFTNYDSFIFDTYKVGLVHTIMFSSTRFSLQILI